MKKEMYKHWGLHHRMVIDLVFLLMFKMANTVISTPEIQMFEERNQILCLILKLSMVTVN